MSSSPDAASSMHSPRKARAKSFTRRMAAGAASQQLSSTSTAQERIWDGKVGSAPTCGVWVRTGQGGGEGGVGVVRGLKTEAG